MLTPPTPRPLTYHANDVVNLIVQPKLAQPVIAHYTLGDGLAGPANRNSRSILNSLMALSEQQKPSLCPARHFASRD